jgi:hypothetical protein
MAGIALKKIEMFFLVLGLMGGTLCVADVHAATLDVDLGAELNVELAKEIDINATAASNDKLKSVLNLDGFASCLMANSPALKVKEIRKKYQLTSDDMATLLPYLAFYPGQRWPGFNTLVQKKGSLLWADRFEATGEKLALRLLQEVKAMPAEKKLMPGQFFKLANEVCGGGDVFCAAITAHNVLRTLGRYMFSAYHNPVSGKDHDYNPNWFKRRSKFWSEQSPLIEKRLVKLANDPTIELYGEWYHFYGVLTYAVFSWVNEGNLDGVKNVVWLDRIATRIFNHHAEKPEKAQLDLDTVQISERFVKKTTSDATDCSMRESYVNPKPSVSDGFRKDH